MEKADVALYHRVLRRENFEKAAKDLVSLVYAAEKKEPGKPRILYLDIDGHRNAQNGFDVDMLELQKEFGLNFLCKCQRKSEPGAHEKVSHKRPRKSEPERSRIVDPVC